MVGCVMCVRVRVCIRLTKQGFRRKQEKVADTFESYQSILFFCSFVGVDKWREVKEKG